MSPGGEPARTTRGTWRARRSSSGPSVRHYCQLVTVNSSSGSGTDNPAAETALASRKPLAGTAHRQSPPLGRFSLNSRKVGNCRVSRQSDTPGRSPFPRPPPSRPAPSATGCRPRTAPRRRRAHWPRLPPRPDQVPPRRSPNSRKFARNAAAPARAGPGKAGGRDDDTGPADRPRRPPRPARRAGWKRLRDDLRQRINFCFRSVTTACTAARKRSMREESMAPIVPTRKVPSAFILPA